MSTSKGGLVGLQYNDFNLRQKSGNWSIEDHAANTNYIRSSEIPNNYLVVGNYNTNKLDLYDIFNKTKIITNIFNIPQSTIKQIEYNYKKSLLVFILTESPYLKIYNTDDFTEYKLTKTFTTPINCFRLSNKGDFIFIGFLEPVDKTYLKMYSIKELTTVSDEIINPSSFKPLSVINSNDILIDRLCTTISMSSDDLYLYIGHYGDRDNIYRNTQFFKKTNNVFNNITSNNLKGLNLLTNTDSLFIENRKLLAIGSFEEPYLNFFNYERQDYFRTYDNIIKNNIKSKVNSLILTKDKNFLLVGCDLEPYINILDLNSLKITPLINNYLNGSITSISSSVNDNYFCITQRSTDYPFLIFNYAKRNFDIFKFEHKSETTPFSSCFFLGPVVEYQEIEKPEFCVSSNNSAVVAVNSENNLIYYGYFYKNGNTISPTDLAAHKNIFCTKTYLSLDFLTTYTTSIKNDGTIISNDTNLLKQNDFINIINIEVYNSRILIQDIYNSIHILENNAFSFDEEYYITKDFIKDIKQISIGNNLVLGLKTDGTIVTSDPTIFDMSILDSFDIKQISVSDNHFSVLLESNTVMTYFFNDTINININTSNWINVKKICSGEDFVIGLKQDKTLYLTGDINEDIKDAILEEKNILDIFTSSIEIILIKSNRKIKIYDTIMNITREIDI